jgi:hypothetical protein
VTVCAICGKDRPGGAVNPATRDFECGGCNPAGSTAQRATRANGRPRP